MGVIAWPEWFAAEGGHYRGRERDAIRPLAGDLVPGGALPVAGRPIVFRQLELLARYGVREVAVLAGHLADALGKSDAARGPAAGHEARILRRARAAGNGAAACRPRGISWPAATSS